MEFIRSTHATPSRRGIRGAVLYGLLALALLVPSAATAQEMKQIKLSETQVQSFIDSYKDVSAQVEKMDPDKPDPKAEAALEATVKKHGFDGLDEYDDVAANIQLVMTGIDPETKAFTEPPEVLKKRIAEVRADTAMKAADKEQELEELALALKEAKPIQFKENVVLVKKHYDKLAAVMQE